MKNTIAAATAKIVRVAGPGGPQYGLLEDATVFALRGDVFGEFQKGEPIGEVDGLRFLAPVVPGKVILTGYNYAGHAEELKKNQPQDPLIFLKAPSAIVGDGDDVVFPRGADNVSYEGELVAVIGRRCRRVSPEDAADYILAIRAVTTLPIATSEARRAVRAREIIRHVRPARPVHRDGLESERTAPRIASERRSEAEQQHEFAHSLAGQARQLGIAIHDALSGRRPLYRYADGRRTH